MRTRFNPSLTLFVSFLLTSAVAVGQASQPLFKLTAVGAAANFAESQPLASLPYEPMTAPAPPDFVYQVPNPVFPAGPPEVRKDPVVDRGRHAGPGGMPEPLVSFGALRNSDNFALRGYRIIPPDTTGAVGPHHYISFVNTMLRVYNKSGTPLRPPIALSTLFRPLGGQCAYPGDNGDIIVIYDHLADRWLLSQFAFINSSTPPFHQCIAISKTGDPMGAYYLYDFIAPPGTPLNDYPHFGLWPDAYYLSNNEGGVSQQGGKGGHYAFDRTKMLQGDPTAGYIYFTTTSPLSKFLPASLLGATLPPAGSPNYFMRYGPNPTTVLRIYEFHADFTNPANSYFRESGDSPLNVAPFTEYPVGCGQCVPQPGTPIGLDAIGERLMYPLYYRNFGSYESITANHTVQVDPGPSRRAGVRYYELRRTLPDGNWSVHEQATYAPDGDEHRWMASGALDHQGNYAIGFSAGGPNTFASIRYAGRLADDPPGGLYQGEATLIEGSGVQIVAPADRGRWGDYSTISLDPSDDCTFWFTTEYYTLASQQSHPLGWLTRVGAFKYPQCNAPVLGQLRGVVRDSRTLLPVNDAFIDTRVGYSRASSGTGSYDMKMPGATYTLFASKPGYETARVPAVTVSNGFETIRDILLRPIVILATGGAAIQNESCKPSNGVIDPGETVSVSFSLRNNGARPTANVVATLLAEGGVENPSLPQSYGVIGGGQSVSRNFTFTAQRALLCAGMLTATLSVRDGALDLGRFSYDFFLGVPLQSREAFDAVTVPTLPDGWTTTATDPSILWRTQRGSIGLDPAHTDPNMAMVPVGVAALIGESALESPEFTVVTANARLSFRHRHNFPINRGGVLEISIGGEPYQDILEAGGSFEAEGYNGVVEDPNNPLFGREAWIRASTPSGYREVIVNLPATAMGQTVSLRWRYGLAAASVTGQQAWRVDTISIDEVACCTTP